jgi:hypothetical protein
LRKHVSFILYGILPLGPPILRLPGAHKKAVRGYHLQPVVSWLRAAAPERMGEAVEGSLFAKAQVNQERFNDVL